MFDVASLLEDVEQKNFALEARAEAEERLSVEKVSYFKLKAMAMISAEGDFRGLTL